jgi:ribosomal peptide maturation radical SAM protein 1
MKVALVSMPWSDHARPSAAIGALLAFVRAQRPAWTVTPRYEYLHIAEAIGYPLYEKLAQDAYVAGELLYLSLLYPERVDASRAQFAARAGLAEVPAESFDDLRTVLDRCADDLARSLAEGEHDVVGFTTCFGQLFANLLVAERLKRLRPGVAIVLGGSTVSAEVGVSILAEYPAIDHVVQGEGELPLLALLDAIAGGGPVGSSSGVLSREEGRAPARPAPLHEVDSLDALPLPDYGEYAEHAIELGIDWALPVEGSRGCWWDRAARTGNPKATCYFCNLNVQWKGYREKNAERLIGEVRELSERYQITKVFFLDNIIRVHGITELARGIAALGKDLELFYEMRANVRPDELVALWEAGLTHAQFGIEALSSSVLKRIGKGTRAIQNLEAMKTCFELGVRHGGNLITSFPGSTDAEVAETVETIRRFAVAYEPCAISVFALGVNSTVDALRAEFGVTNVRNLDALSAVLPDKARTRLKLFDRNFDAANPADWTPVKDAVAAWRERQRAIGEPLLSYTDGGSFLRIIDRRQDHRIAVLEGLQRALYLGCMRIRSGREIAARFGEEAMDVMRQLVELDLVFEEGGRYLALATAQSARVAAARIRAEAADAEAA